VAPFVVSLVTETGESFATVGKFEGTIYNSGAEMHCKVVPFGEVFVTAIDWALVQNI
jgi:hypothetical protein